MTYYTSENGQILGPFDLSQLKEKVHRGELPSTASVCAAGTNQWEPLAAVLGPTFPPAPNTPSADSPLRVQTPSPPPKSGRGCLLYGCLGLILIVFGLPAAAYYFLIHTSLPFKWIEASLPVNDNFAVRGITGSIASGMKIQSIRIRGEQGDSCDIEEVHTESTGFWDLMMNHRIIIREISVAKAHFVVSSSSSSVEVTRGGGAFPQSSPGFPSQNPQNPQNPQNSPQNSPQNPLELFRIDRIHFADVYFKDQTTGFEISVPAFEYTGFKVDHGKVDLGKLTVESDRLDLRTSEGRTVEIDGQRVNFQKRIEGTLKPLLHRFIRKPVSFILDIGTTPDDRLFCHVSALDDKLQAFMRSDQSGYVRAQDFPMADYFAAAPYDLPQKLTLDVSLVGEKDLQPASLRINHGSFTLGQADFEIQPVGYADSPDPHVRLDVRAIHRTSNGQIIANLLCKSRPSSISPSWDANPAMSLPDILATIFFSKNYAALTATEQETIDAKVAAYGDKGTR